MSDRSDNSSFAWMPMVVCCILAGIVAGCATTVVNNGNANQNAGDQPVMARFVDPDSDFSTDVVRDIDGETFSFDTTNQQMVWLADGRTFDGWRVDGEALLIGISEFRVRFGTEGGVRQAYFTEVNPPTICDLVADGDQLGIFRTNTPVPQE